ncbi:MAG TPA: MerR family DNA-binding protein [Pseudomonadales bacterium]|nr:MerR family DNA-binding protein [Pseudomonadales bacterium]
MKVAELARSAGVTPETVRHYVRVGLMEPDRDPHNGYRVFHAHHVDRLRFIRRARALGFSVNDVVEILAHAEHGDSPCPVVRDLAQERLEEVRTRLAELDRQRRRLERVLVLWDGLPDGVPDGRRICPLIEEAAEQEAEHSDGA